MRVHATARLCYVGAMAINRANAADLAPAARRIHGFPAVAGRGARVLILGSMPGKASLAAKQYYAHPRNDFWPILGTLFDFAPDAPYRERLRALRRQHIALWDVLRCCQRRSSLDSDIIVNEDGFNDFDSFFARHRQLHHVFFNGAKAETLFHRLGRQSTADWPGYLRCQRLPSTSPAHAALSTRQKLGAWRAIQRALA